MTDTNPAIDELQAQIEQLKAQVKSLENVARERIAFQAHLTNLHELRARFIKFDTLSELYQGAVITGTTELGFDRLAIFQIDFDSNEIQGTYGTDEHGHVVDESDYVSPIASHPRLDAVLQNEQYVALWKDVDLLQQDKLVGKGWNAMAGLWDGNNVIGYVVVDNLVTGRPVRSYEQDLLALFASILAHAISYKKSQADHLNFVKQQERIQTMQRFIEAITHDFKTPLTSIYSYLYLIDQAAQSDQTKKYSDAIYQQIERLNLIIDDIVDMSRLEQIESFTVTPIRLVHTISDIKTQFDSRLHERNQTIKIVTNDDVPKIMGNALYINMLFSHIIRNALQYSPDDSTIVVKLYADEKNVLVDVIDEGTGIAEEEQEKIFEHFYRIAQERDTITGGTGMGLSIAQSIVEMHYGYISVESTLGEGSTFTVGFPRVIG